MKFPNTADYVYTFRKKHHLTQKQLAEVIGCHSQMISNIERGQCAIPTRALYSLRFKFGSKFNVQNYSKAFMLDKMTQARRRVKNA